MSLIRDLGSAAAPKEEQAHISVTENAQEENDTTQADVEKPYLTCVARHYELRHR